MSESTEQLIALLRRSLTPVRPVPRLRTVGFAVVAGWAVSAGVGTAVTGWRPDLDAAFASGGYVSVLLGLCLVGAGGVLAALAGVVPGREALARIGLLLAVAGLVAAVAIGSALHVWSLSHALVLPIAECQLRAVAMALLPGCALLLFLRRGFPGRLPLALLAAAAGAVGLGALPVHLSCPMNGGAHVILGHALAPVVAAAVLFVPLRLVARPA